MALKDEIIDRVITREGGAKIVQNPNDPGGLTKFGISQKAYPNEDIRNLTLQRARELYEQDYYLRWHIHLLPEKYQESVLDFAVHSGGQKAVETLQKLLGVPQDGVIGPQTVAAASTQPSGLLFAYQRERINYLVRQVEAQPKKLGFLRGWLMRVLTLPF